MRVELIYDADCPNVAATRERLREVLVQGGAGPGWKEWERADPQSPPRARHYGSPTILVGGLDIGGLGPSDGAPSCRIYTNSAGETEGIPPAEMIASALERARRPGWRGLLSVAPGIGASVLPVGACPACWPAYAGLLSALGLGFVLETRYLIPIATVPLVAALFSLGYRARSRRGYGPFALGALGTTVALGGKFLLLSNAALYAGLGVLVAASVWNSWPRSATDSGPCPACVPGIGTSYIQDARTGESP